MPQWHGILRFARWNFFFFIFCSRSLFSVLFFLVTRTDRVYCESFCTIYPAPKVLEWICIYIVWRSIPEKRNENLTCICIHVIWRVSDITIYAFQLRVKNCVLWKSRRCFSLLYRVHKSEILKEKLVLRRAKSSSPYLMTEFCYAPCYKLAEFNMYFYSSCS